MVGWAIDRGEQKWRFFIAAKPMPAAKDMSKAVGASQVQGRAWCGMAGISLIDVELWLMDEELSEIGTVPRENGRVNDQENTQETCS